MFYFFQGSDGINCSKTFTEPHYGIGGKCFPTTANSFSAIWDVFFKIKVPKSRYQSINAR